MPERKRRSNRLEAIGLEKYLDQTMHKHNMRGYASFVMLLDGNASVSLIARIFGVNRHTARSWRDLYYAEQNKHNDDQ